MIIKHFLVAESHFLLLQQNCKFKRERQVSFPTLDYIKYIASSLNIAFSSNIESINIHVIYQFC